jgi:hypothetical protein
MKTLVVIAALSLGISYANAQKVKEAEVPAPVKAALSKQYPAVKDAKWNKEEANFEAEFDLNKVETSLLIDAKGNILETETEIEASALPKAVYEYVTKKLGGKKIKEASKIIDAKGTTTYEAEIEKADYVFDANGSFVKKVEEKGKKDDEKK